MLGYYFNSEQQLTDFCNSEVIRDYIKHISGIECRSQGQSDIDLYGKKRNKYCVESYCETISSRSIYKITKLFIDVNDDAISNEQIEKARDKFDGKIITFISDYE